MHHRKAPLSLAALLLCGVLCSTAAIAADAVWIDVRSVEENRLDGIPGDPNVPHEEIGSAIAALVPDKSREIVLYCRSGRRSGIAQQALQRLGYVNVRNAGGIEQARREHPAAATERCC